MSLACLRISEIERNASSGWAVCPGVALLLVLSGCASMQVRLGLMVSLPKTPVSSISASLPKGPGMAPGDAFPLIVSVTKPDGKMLVTEGEGGGRILWQDLQVTTTIAVANKKGVVSLSEDPRISDGKLPHVTVTVPSHPDVRADLDIPVRYDRKFIANFSGGTGSSGSDGMNGTDGMSGSTGSYDPDHPVAGGDGSSGGDGSPGGVGGPGGNGPPVQVRVALRSGSHPLLQVGVSAEGRERLFLVDPQGGSLTVSSDGGSGGPGGKGGRGGRGGSGGSGSPRGSDGRDGSNGSDGSSGSSGRGGSITVTYDPAVTPFLNMIRLSNRGGSRPAFKEEPVPALW
jgi:hypothetical protein